jgi:hypothetical protein
MGSKRRGVGLVIVSLLAVTLTGCSAYNNQRGRGDAPVGPVDNSGAEVVQFPDNFANVATKCDAHGHRLFVTTRGDQRPAQLDVLVDPSCGAVR